jgi:hypothetical protein
MTTTYASWRKYKGNYTRGRLVVSEDPITPAETLYPDCTAANPTLFYDYEDDRFEIVAVKGTILTLYVSATGQSGVETPTLSHCTSTAVPFAVARTDLYRQFDEGDSQIASYIRRGYIEVPFIPSTICPTSQTVAGYTGSATGTLVPGDVVKSDSLGRFVKMTSGDSIALRVGQVVTIEKFGTTYDTGMLEWYKWNTRDFEDYLHQLEETDPYLHTADWHTLYSSATSPFHGERGIRQNLDVMGAQGAVRIWLML